MWGRPERFRCVPVIAGDEERMPELRVTLDTEQDLVVLRCLFDLLGPNFSCRELVAFAKRHPWLLKINEKVEQKPVFISKDRRFRSASELCYAAEYCLRQDLDVAASLLVEEGIRALDTEIGGITTGSRVKEKFEWLKRRLSAFRE